MYTINNLNNMMTVREKMNHGELKSLFEKINPSVEVLESIEVTQDYCIAYADSSQPIIKVMAKDNTSYIVYISKENSEITWS